MRYAQFDYHPAQTAGGSKQMSEWWARHWEGRSGLKQDLRDEALWPTIADVVQAPGRLLEAGCGVAKWVQFFDSLGHKTVGLDYAPSGLQLSKRANQSLRLLSGDFRRLPFPDNSFDYVYCNGGVEHDIDGPEAALEEFRRVLKPTGRLMCSVPCLNVKRQLTLPLLMLRDWLKRRTTLRRLAGKIEPFEFYQYVHSPRTYTTMLERCGFEMIALRPYMTPNSTGVARLLTKIFGATSRFPDPHMMMAICRKAGCAANQDTSDTSSLLDRVPA